MKKSIPAIILILVFSLKIQAQWLNPNQLTDMNTWSNQPGFIGWYGGAANVPGGFGYGSGITMVLPADSRFGTQIVAPVFDNQLYYRQNRAGTWDSWATLWSTNNFDPDTYLDRSVAAISTPGSADAFSNGYTFAYKPSGTPWYGSLISFGGFGGNYDTQINSDYGPHGGVHISFRTMNGDTHVWNGWNEFYHSGNFNNANTDFTARTINCSNVYTNGNIWSKQVVVALTNPWPDYVFKKDYQLMPLAQVKSYIDANNHLPDMPSAAEVEKSGLDLGEMNKLLTKKVEELTLYLIEKDKKEKQQDELIKKMEQRLSALENQ